MTPHSIEAQSPGVPLLEIPSGNLTGNSYLEPCNLFKPWKCETSWVLFLESFLGLPELGSLGGLEPSLKPLLGVKKKFRGQKKARRVKKKGSEGQKKRIPGSKKRSPACSGGSEKSVNLFFDPGVKKAGSGSKKGWRVNKKGKSVKKRPFHFKIISRPMS